MQRLQRLLAGLVNIVPEFTKLGQPNGLVGDRALAVIDQEYEARSEQQHSDKAE